MLRLLVIGLASSLLISSSAPSGIVPWPPVPRPGQQPPPDPLAGSYDPRPQPSPAPLDQVSITLQRTGCFGSCPSYQVEIRGDGTARYQGQSYVLLDGEHRDRVAPAAVQCLLDFLNKAGFWGLEGEYSMPVTDIPTYRLTVTVGDVRKTVIDYAGEGAGMPHAVTQVEDAVDRLVGRRWSRGDGLTIARLTDEGFDFKSRAGATLLATSAIWAPEDVSLDVLSRGASPKGRSLPMGWNHGQSAVFGAAGAGKARLVSALIAAGAFAVPNARREKAAALLAAAGSGKPDAVAAVLTAKPPVNLADKRGRRPLTSINDLAAGRWERADRLEIVRMLLEAGADPRLTDEYGNTALHSAASVAEVQLLLAKGARVNAANRFGDTPLIYAASDDIAMALIEAGADYRATDQRGDSAASRAVAMGFPRTLAFLRASGVAIPSPEPSPSYKSLRSPRKDDAPICLV